MSEESPVISVTTMTKKAAQELTGQESTPAVMLHDSFDPEFDHKLSGTKARRQALERKGKFLEWIKSKHDPEKIYYPGCGFDQLPREVFGEEKCTYTSLNDGTYFEQGNPPEVAADIKRAPFPDEAFDLIYLQLNPEFWRDNIPELLRVLKRKGHLVFACDLWPLQEQEELIEKLIETEQLKDVTPRRFRKTKFPTYLLGSQEEGGWMVSKKVYDQNIRAGRTGTEYGQILRVLEKPSK